MDENLISDVKTLPCWGEQVCATRGWSFDEVFRTQFRISQAPAVSSSTWVKRRLGDFWIEHCPQLPATEVRNRRGQVIGWCLGVAIDAAGDAIGCDNGHVVTVTATFDAIERRLSQLAGRFALVVMVGDETRYYPDATSGLTAVSNPELSTIASTVTLAINDEIKPSGGRSLQEVQRKPTLYLMGETPDARVTQVQGNHYIDMSRFTAHRFWPSDDTVFEPHDATRQSVVAITERLQTVMAGLVTNFDCTLPITGGRDSRLLAAAVRADVADRVSQYYVHEINWATSYDVESSRRVAAHLQVPLTVKNVRSGDCASELADLDVRKTRLQLALATGFAHPSLHYTVLQNMHVAPDTRLFLRGGAAEVVQANKWPATLRIPDQVTPEFAFQRLAGHGMQDLLRLFGKVTIERYWEKYKNWFAQLPEGARNSAVDIGHMELWLSSGMGAVFYAPRQQFYMNPFSDRSLLYQTMRFDPKTRKKGRLTKVLLDEMSPGLAEIPYARQLMNEARAA